MAGWCVNKRRIRDEEAWPGGDGSVEESDLTLALGAGILSAPCSVGLTTRLRKGVNPLVEGGSKRAGAWPPGSNSGSVNEGSMLPIVIV